MRRILLILAVLILVAVSGKDAHAKLFFGTQDKINHLQDLSLKGPNDEALYLGFVTSTHSFLLPYSMSDGGYVLGIKGTSDKFYKLPKERIEQMQRAGVLPNRLPVYQRSSGDYIIGYVLWPVLLITAVACFFQSRRRSSGAYGETRSA
jgi:hypothetical protein